MLFNFNGKNPYVTFLICIFFGIFGFHRFYTKNRYGFIYLLTFGLFGLVWIIDLFRISISILILLFKNKPKIGLRPIYFPNHRTTVNTDYSYEHLKNTQEYEEILNSLNTLYLKDLDIDMSNSIDAELRYIDNLDGYQFEEYTSKLLSKIGYSNVTVTSASNDYGVDVLSEKDGLKYAFQCKLYSSPVGNDAIQQVNTGKSYYGCHVCAVITNNYFTSNAKSLAEKVGVLLWDRNTLSDILNKTGYTKNLLICIPDDLMPLALLLFFKENQASVSFLQRKLKIGYSQAARIIDEFEKLKIISPFDNSTPRVLLLNYEQFIEYSNNEFKRLLLT